MIVDRFLRKGWARGVVEVLLVAAGVILAFAVDSWADARRDREIEHGYLIRLEREFVHNLAMADSAAHVFRLSIRASGDLQRHMAGNPPELPNDSLATLFQHAFQTFHISAQAATYADLVGSGQLGVLRSDSLRILVAGWEALFGWYEFSKQKELLSWVEVAEPYATAHLPMSRLFGQFLGEADFPSSPFQFNYAEILRDPELWNILTFKVLHANDLRRASEALVDRAAMILDVIRDERARFE